MEILTFSQSAIRVRILRITKGFVLKIILLFLLFSACFSNTPKRNPSQELRYLSELKDFENAQSLFDQTVGIRSLKYTIFLSDKDQIEESYFQNTNLYKYHLDFLKEEKGFLLSPEEFTERLFNPHNKIFAGTVYLLDKDSLGIQIIAHEKTKEDAELIQNYLNIIRPLFQESKKIVYLHNDASEIFLKNSNFEKISFNEAFKSKKPIIYNHGKSYGYIRILNRAQAEKGLYGPKDILILDSIPLNLSPVSGIITRVPQVPNSHVYLRAKELKIPNIYLPSEYFDETIFSYKNKMVEFWVNKEGDLSLIGPEKFGLNEIMVRADKYYESRKPLEAKLQMGVEFNFFPFSYDKKLRKNMPINYGAKGTNFYLIYRTLEQSSDFQHGFLTPSRFYLNFIKSNRLMYPVCSEVFNLCEEKIKSPYCQDFYSICEERALKTTPASLKKQKSEYEKLKIKKFTDNELNERLLAIQSYMSRYERYGQNADRLDEFIKYFLIKEKNDLVANPEKRRSFLFSLREVIKRHPLKDLNQITERMNKLDPKRKWRMRSSTNAEDLPFFVGAGLYESTAVCVHDTFNNYEGDSACRTKDEIESIKKKVLKAKDENNSADEKYFQSKLLKRYPIITNMKKVFASIFNDEAFLFRDYYGLDHDKVFMGVLTHPSFDNEKANGVAIIEPEQGLYNLSSQVDDNLITNPFRPGELPEEVQIKDGKVKYTAYSNILEEGRKYVLKPNQVVELKQKVDLVIKSMEDFYYPGYGKKYDVEYILTESNQIMILQIRPIEQNPRIIKYPKSILEFNPNRADYITNNHGWSDFIIHSQSGISLAFSTEYNSLRNDFGFARPIYKYTNFRIFKNNVMISEQMMPLREGDQKYKRGDEWYSSRAFCQMILPSEGRLLDHLDKFNNFKLKDNKLCEHTFKKENFTILCFANSPMGNIVLISEKGKTPTKGRIDINEPDFDKYWYFDELQDLADHYENYNVIEYLPENIFLCLNNEKMKIRSGFKVDSWSYFRGSRSDNGAAKIDLAEKSRLRDARQ